MKSALARRRAATVRTAVAFLAAPLLTGCGGAPRAPRATIDVAAALGAAGGMAGVADTGFAHALEPRPFVFPADHGPHPGFRTEWWYFTGNVRDARGRRFGFELTFFRNALTAQPARRASAWAASDVYMAHFALTDAAAGRFHAFDRFARAALGLAGARTTPLRVWTEAWSAEAVPDSAAAGIPLTPGTPPLRLRAAAGDVALDLVLGSAAPPVPNGEAGLSRKGEAAGNASYYYSMMEMPVRGSVRTAAGTFAVQGGAWMDREWGTSALPPGDVGWDWFALQLADGARLMYYRLRRDDGAASRFSAGTLVAADGRVEPLRAGDVVITPTGTWRSPIDGAPYPAGWRLDLPARNISLTVTPVLPDQELDLAVRYWEGAVDAVGRGPGGPLHGVGYVELTGYATAPHAAARLLPR